MPYFKIPQCRVCKHPDDNRVTAIDKRLLEGTPYQEIIAEFAAFFRDDEPLTQVSLMGHKRHLIKSIPLQMAGASELVQNTQGELASSNRSSAFDKSTLDLRESLLILDTLTESALTDLSTSDKMMHDTRSGKEQAGFLSVRDNIRRSVLEIVRISKDLVDPSLTINADVNNAFLIELLSLIKKSAMDTIKDDFLRNQLFNEITSNMRKSKSLRWMAEKAPVQPQT